MNVPVKKHVVKHGMRLNQKGEKKAYADGFQKYHNCRLRHRIEDTKKPAQFRPHCNHTVPMLKD